jgi:hypothetical protein
MGMRMVREREGRRKSSSKKSVTMRVVMRHSRAVL